MKVLLVSHTSDPGNGWGRYTRDLARALESRGHEVVVLCDWLVKMGRRPLSDPDTYLGYVPHWIRDSFLIRDAIRAEDPDVLHVTVEPYLSAVPLSYISPERKLFTTVHGTYALYPKLMPSLARHLGLWVYARALRKVSAVIPVSHNTSRVYESLLHESKVALPPISVVHNGVWINDHGLPILNQEDKEGFTILSVGAVKARKGILEVVRGIAALKEQFGITAQYRIIGSIDSLDTYVDKIKAFAGERGILQQLAFVGPRHGDELEDELRHAHVLALLPRATGNSLEGFGLVYLEANAYGVPALGARGTVSEEAIQEGKSGLLCDADNANDVARALISLKEGAINAGTARAWAEAHDWSKIVDKFLAVYQKS